MIPFNKSTHPYFEIINLNTVYIHILYISNMQLGITGVILNGYFLLMYFTQSVNQKLVYMISLGLILWIIG